MNFFFINGASKESSFLKKNNLNNKLQLGVFNITSKFFAQQFIARLYRNLRKIQFLKHNIISTYLSKNLKTTKVWLKLKILISKFNLTKSL